MSEELIKSLNQRINELSSELADTKSEAKKRRLEVKALREERDHVASERDELAQGYEALDKEYADHKAQAEAHPSELQARIDELTGKIRTGTHRAAFDKIADAARVRPEARDDLWKHLEYKAESDEVDEAKLSGLVGEALKGRTYLLAPDETSTNGARDGSKPAPRPLLRTDGDGGRGDRDTLARSFRVTEANLRDPRWVHDNQKQMQEAQKAGTLEVVEA